MSVPPDIMQALMGGGGAPMMGGLPPDVMGALGGEAPEEAPASMSGDEGTPGGSDGFIRDAIDLLAQAAQAEGDEEDILVIQTAMTNLQKVLANNQKNADQMMGGSATPSGMRKAAGAVAGGY